MKLRYRYRQLRSKWRRAKRLLFVSPAESQFIAIMGGWTVRISWLRTLSGCQLVVLYSLGKTLKRWQMVRELKVASGTYCDFGSPDWFKAIEVDGLRWHLNVIADAERDERIQKEGYDILHIRYEELRNPLKVRAKVNKFLSR